MFRNLYLWLFFLEGLIRKFIFSSVTLIPIKYILLAFYIPKNKNNNLWILLISLLNIPIIFQFFSNESYKDISIAIAAYDLLTFSIYPFILIGISNFAFTKKIVKEKYLNKILKNIYFLSILSPTLTIIQSYLDKDHFLNRTTADSAFITAYSSLAGDGSILFKATGLLGSAQGCFEVVVLAFCFSGYKFINFKKTNNNFYIDKIINNFLPILLVSAAIFRNLSSRTYLLNISLFVVIYIFLVMQRNYKGFVRSILISILIISIATTSSFFIGQGGITKRGNLNEITKAIIARAGVTYNFTEGMDKNQRFQIMDGPGLGITANRLNYSTRKILASYPKCGDIFSEYEFTRILCAFGNYGFILIFFLRFLPAFIIIRFALNLKNKSYNSTIVASFFWSAVLILIGAQFKTNDVFILITLPLLSMHYLIGYKHLKKKYE